LARVSAAESASPTPTACDRTRLTCSSRIWSPAIRTSLSFPTPVVTASATLSLATISSTTVRARSTASRASADKSTGRRSLIRAISVCATSRTSSSVRSLPLMWRAFKSVSCFWFPISSGSICFSQSFAEDLHILFRQLGNFHRCIGNDVRSLAFGQQHAISHAPQFVAKVDHRLAHVQQLRAHQHFFVVTHRTDIAAFSLGHGDEAVVLALHVTIRKTELS